MTEENIAQGKPFFIRDRALQEFCEGCNGGGDCPDESCPFYCGQDLADEEDSAEVPE